MKIPTPSFIYVLYSTDMALWWVLKVGISADPGARRRQIEYELGRSTGGRVRIHTAVQLPLFFVDRYERRLHAILSRLRCDNVPSHAGHTEWFYKASPICATLFVLTLRHFGLEASAAYWLVICFQPYPADAVLLALAHAVVQYGAAAAIMYTIFNLAASAL